MRRMAAQTRSIFKRSRFDFAANSSRYDPVISTPVTRTPCLARGVEIRPIPQGQSRKRLPFFKPSFLVIYLTSVAVSLGLRSSKNGLKAGKKSVHQSFDFAIFLLRHRYFSSHNILQPEQNGGKRKPDEMP